MASDQVVIVLGILAVAGPIATQALNLRSQARLEKQRQAHELRRDQQAKYYEIRLQEYRERREACQSLLASVNQQSILASASQRAREALALPQTAESRAAATAEGQLFTESLGLGAKYADRALQRLGVDERAAGVIDAYYSLPIRRLVDAPDAKDVRQAWKEARGALRRAVFDYLRGLDGQLRADDTSVPSPSHQS
jgi:phage gp46-like protein